MKNKTPENMMFILVALLAGIGGGAFCMAINGYENLGTAADWVSGIGSAAAIIFAYWQIDEQRKQYEKEKIPLFEISISSILNSSDETFFLSAEKISPKVDSHYFSFSEQKKQFLLTDRKFFYCVKNIANYDAINPTLVITYKSYRMNDNLNKEDIVHTDLENLYHTETETDIIHAETTIKNGEKARLLTNDVINNSYMSIVRAKKKIELYFMSTEGNYYKQTFKEHIEKVFRDDGTVPDELTFISDGIKDIKKSELPDYYTAPEMKVITKQDSSLEIVPIDKSVLY